MEMKHSSTSFESKRKAQKEEADEASLFKKARYEWQIKGESSKDSKVPKYQTTEIQLDLDRTEDDIVTCSKLQEDATSTETKLINVNNASFQSEIKDVNNPDITSQDQTSKSEKEQRSVYFSHVSYTGHPSGTFESPKYRETSVRVDPAVSDRASSNNSLQTCHISQTKGSNSRSTLTELPATDQSDLDSNLDSRDAFVGLSSSVSTSIRRGYNPHSSTTSTSSNELQFNSFLAKRQNSHIAKAVVDNAINKTLEDMGVSPDTNNDSFVTGKCNVEDAGISQAIQSQGLIPQHQALESQGVISQHQAAVCNARLAPILSHVTHLSDMVFSQGHLQPNCLADTRNIIIDQNSAFAATSVSTSVSASSSDLLDQAVSMAISSRGLALQRDLDVL